MSISAQQADEIAQKLSQQGREEEAMSIRHAVANYFLDVEAELGRRPYEPRDLDIQNMAEQDWEYTKSELLADHRPTPADLTSHLLHTSGLDQDVADEVTKQFVTMLQRWIIFGAKNPDAFFELVMAKMFGSEIEAHTKFLRSRGSERYGSDWIAARTIKDFTQSLKDLASDISERLGAAESSNPAERAMYARQYMDMATGRIPRSRASDNFPDLLRRSAKVALYLSPGRTAGEWIEPYREVYINEELDAHAERLKEDFIRRSYSEISDRIQEELADRDVEAGETLGLEYPLLPSWESGQFARVVDEGMLQFVAKDCPAYRLDIDLVTRLLSHVYGEFSNVEPFSDVLAAAQAGERNVSQLVQKAGISANG